MANQLVSPAGEGGNEVRTGNPGAESRKPEYFPDPLSFVRPVCGANVKTSSHKEE